MFVFIIFAEVYLTERGVNSLQIISLSGSFTVSQRMNSELFTDLECVSYYAHNKSGSSSANAPFKLQKLNEKLHYPAPFTGISAIK